MSICRARLRITPKPVHYVPTDKIADCNNMLFLNRISVQISTV